MPKKTKRRDPLGFFNIPYVAKYFKKEGSPFGDFFPKKVSQCRKTDRGEPFSLARYGMLRGKRGKTFLVQFVRANESIWDHKFV